MKIYEEKCPICGTLNKNLYLEETDGWMECVNCRTVVKNRILPKVVKIPIYTGEELARVFSGNT